MFLSVFLFTISFYLHQATSGDLSELKLITSGCICPGYTLIYECTVVGVFVGTTVWQGTALNCEVGTVIHLLHSEFVSQGGAFGNCNGDAIVGRSLRIEDNRYISQLRVMVTNDMNGETIECVYDNGATTTKIGNYSISLTSTVPLLPVNDITWKVLGGSVLIFHWSSVDTTCPTVHYNILSSNCGSCLMNTTNTTATCTDVPNEADKSKAGVCSFAVQTVICGNISGNNSDTVTVPLSIIHSTNNSLFIDSKNWSNVTMIQGITGSAVIAVSSVLSMLLVVCTVALSSVLLLLIKAKQEIRALKSRAATSQTPAIYSTPMLSIHTQENVAYEFTGLSRVSAGD